MKKRTLFALAAVAVAAVLGVAVAVALDSPAINWWVMGGGGRAASGALVVNDTLGQPVIGPSQGGNVTLSAGYWNPSNGPASTYPITLTAGWNLISSPLAPLNPLVTETLRSITSSYDLVYAYRAEDALDPWKKYSTTAPGFLNDLKVITEVMGIWLHATSNVTLTITGTLPVTTAIPLSVGWNLVGYPTFVTQPVTVALASCAGSYNLVYAYHAEDALDPWKKYSTTAPDFLNDLKVMAPGRGYWINATAACVWRP